MTISAQLDRWKQEEGPEELKTLKTEDGYRSIDLHPALVSVLRGTSKAASLEKGSTPGDSFAFCTEDGGRCRTGTPAVILRLPPRKAKLNGEGLRPVLRPVCSGTPSPRD